MAELKDIISKQESDDILKSIPALKKVCSYMKNQREIEYQEVFATEIVLDFLDTLLDLIYKANEQT